MNTIFLIRHGEIARSIPRRFIGCSDITLTSQGREQIVRLAAHLASRAIGRVVCSPLSRTRESAAILCRTLACEPEVVRDLREIGLGAWEGLSIAEVQARFPGEYEARGRDLQYFRPSGGESFDDLLGRVWPVFKKLAAGGDRRVAVVAHAGVNRVILCRLLGVPLANLLRLEQHYGCVNTVSCNERGWQVESINVVFD